MFHRILLPVDLSDDSARSVDAAIQLVAPDHGTVTLLHVIETIADVEFEEMQEFYSRLERKAQARLEDLAAPLVEADLTVERQVVYGKRVREIVLFAAEHRHDLVLMRSRRLDPTSPDAAWGSISHQVAVLANCPVLLLK